MRKFLNLLLLAMLALTACGGDVFTDDRDGKAYKTVKIGKQVWMAENLNYEADGSKCYGNEPENCGKYGRLYNWDAAMKACPKKWHLPAKEKWNALAVAVGGEKTEDAKHLKAKEGWNSNGNGTDDYGFAALPGGGGHSGGDFHFAGNYGIWWSASEYSAYEAYYRNMSGSEYADWSHRNKTDLFSVRCIRD